MTEVVPEAGGDAMIVTHDKIGRLAEAWADVMRGRMLMATTRHGVRVLYAWDEHEGHWRCLASTANDENAATRVALAMFADELSVLNLEDDLPSVNAEAIANFGLAKNVLAVVWAERDMSFTEDEMARRSAGHIYFADGSIPVDEIAFFLRFIHNGTLLDFCRTCEEIAVKRVDPIDRLNTWALPYVSSPQAIACMLAEIDDCQQHGESLNEYRFVDYLRRHLPIEDQRKLGIESSFSDTPEESDR